MIYLPWRCLVTNRIGWDHHRKWQVPPPHPSYLAPWWPLREMPAAAFPCSGPTDVPQVWSLTQFYSVDFSKSRIDVKKCVFNKRTIKVCVSCCWRCPGTSAPSAPHLTVSLYLCSSGSNAQGESRAREGRHVSSKSPSNLIFLHIWQIVQALLFPLFKVNLKKPL